ncbi:response regulator [Candidatus Poribacteria bacterium]|nr:response regulator [Candidatus Poribacteria bacterium]
MNNGYKIFWLDDEPSKIADLTGCLQAEEDFTVEVFEESTKALTAIKEFPPDLFIVDILLGDSDSDGLSIAKTAREMISSMQIAAVTAHLPSYARQIASDLAERQYPFAVTWDKIKLGEPKAKKTFVKEVRLLCRSELHVGEVTELEDDYAQVTLRTPKGNEYTRFFETEFLEACGISKVGDNIELFFWKIADGASGDVHMRITKRAVKEDTAAKVKEIISKVDLGKIRKKFGPRRRQVTAKLEPVC